MMQRGDHLISPRAGYFHHGLYLSSQCVIHYAGFASKTSNGKIALVSLDDFCQGNGCSVKNHPVRIYDSEASIQRAYSRLGEQSYSVAFNNCEHFVNWCIQGEHTSEQVNAVAEGMHIGLGTSFPVNNETLMRDLSQLGGSVGQSAANKIGAGMVGFIAPTLAPAVGSAVIGLAIGMGIKLLAEWLSKK